MFKTKTVSVKWFVNAAFKYFSATCVFDNQKFSVVMANIAISEQIGEMLIHCKYGCKLSDEGEGYVPDPTRCPVTVKISCRR